MIMMMKTTNTMNNAVPSYYSLFSYYFLLFFFILYILYSGIFYNLLVWFFALDENSPACMLEVLVPGTCSDGFSTTVLLVLQKLRKNNTWGGSGSFPIMKLKKKFYCKIRVLVLYIIFCKSYSCEYCTRYTVKKITSLLITKKYAGIYQKLPGNSTR
jgi:hypothetical protein